MAFNFVLNSIIIVNIILVLLVLSIKNSAKSYAQSCND